MAIFIFDVLILDMKFVIEQPACLLGSNAPGVRGLSRAYTRSSDNERTNQSAARAISEPGTAQAWL